MPVIVEERIAEICIQQELGSRWDLAPEITLFMALVVTPWYSVDPFVTLNDRITKKKNY